MQPVRSSASAYALRALVDRERSILIYIIFITYPGQPIDACPTHHSLTCANIVCTSIDFDLASAMPSSSSD
jgi:hypothetical protein